MSETPRLRGVRLPEITGSSLAGVDYSFPADLDARATLLVIAFRQHQQIDVDTWLPTAQRLAREHEGFAYFEIPLLDVRWRPARTWIDGGMRSGITDPHVRATTMTAYQRRRPFLRRLGLESPDQIVVVLVDGLGDIQWAALGPLHPPSEPSLENAVADIVGAD